MSISDLLLTTVILTAIAFGLWVKDVNPFTNQLHVYNQDCTNMILNNTFCKGSWTDSNIAVFAVDSSANTVKHYIDSASKPQSYNNCSIVDRKNWFCALDEDISSIQAKNGIIIREPKITSSTRQISRFEWLQNKIRMMISNK